MSGSNHIPKAVLYYDARSAWSLAGYGKDELEPRLVELSKGENFSPTFLRLNPKGTVPTLVVPFENTLPADMESRYKAITETEALIAFLDKSRSIMSHTHTTSAAPAPDLPALRTVAPAVSAFLKGRKAALERYLSENEGNEIRVSEKTKKFWLEKKKATEDLLTPLNEADKGDPELSEVGRKAREEYFEKTKAAWEVGLALVLNEINKELIGPFALGEQISIVDVHLAAWLHELVILSGGTAQDSGVVAMSRLEEHVGGGFAFAKEGVSEAPTAAGATTSSDGSTPALATTGSKSKLAALWDALAGRPSWQNVFGIRG
ncbi:hypothetical protein B0F90DRAFT_1681198 [Multifurca ochricompacta]|uniref:GST N-terminal domain-containing protein n=1 Tax=Multifurca ochricompacta TaxID=376703 RepID=A0AAD4MD77_9AGAM|nr:hypothetical protein B0F90DRAFT_1681198 [Multifurca ochricompacta]